MATKIYEFEGVCKWAHRLFQMDPEYKNYTIQLYPNEDSLKLYRESGLRGRLNMDDDGLFVTFRRPHSKMIKDEVVEFGPPKVTWAHDGSEFEGSLGNGSTVKCVMAVYDTNFGGKSSKGGRLNEVKVIDYVEYKKPEEISTEVISEPVMDKALKKSSKKVPFN